MGNLCDALTGSCSGSARVYAKLALKFSRAHATLSDFSRAPGFSRAAFLVSPPLLSLNPTCLTFSQSHTFQCEQDMQSVREQMYRLQDEIAHLRLAEQYPESTKSNSRSRSREEKRKKKRRSDEGDSYYSDETTPGMERSYTPTSFSSRRSTHRGSISSNSVSRLPWIVFTVIL